MSEDKRDRILDAALCLINRYGFDKTTVSEIAREAGIAKGTVYLYFQSKDEIYYALLARESNRNKERIIPKLQAAADPVEKLRLFLLEVGMTLLENEFARQTLKRDYLPRFQGYANSDVGRQHGDEGVAFLVAMLEDGMAKGYFRNLDPTRVALVMYNNISSLVLLSMLMEDMYSTEEIKELIRVNADLMVHGLVKEDAK
ncbi:MAG: TetR/AcrR family transcriptional regulator [Firmicutes bacterium]|nr:TetR/AcrR family transcriptional regulator [Bacillota bacterium]